MDTPLTAYPEEVPEGGPMSGNEPSDAGDEMEQAPGFLEIGLVAHCGHTSKASSCGP